MGGERERRLRLAAGVRAPFSAELRHDGGCARRRAGPRQLGAAAGGPAVAEVIELQTR
jgi:hypothetical protein